MSGGSHSSQTPCRRQSNLKIIARQRLLSASRAHFMMPIAAAATLAWNRIAGVYASLLEISFEVQKSLLSPWTACRISDVQQ